MMHTSTRLDAPQVALVATLSFFVVLGYFSLNEAAAELEHPYGLGANHLALTAWQRAFNSKLARLLNSRTPKLGYEPEMPRGTPNPRQPALDPKQTSAPVTPLAAEACAPAEAPAAEPPVSWNGRVRVSPHGGVAKAPPGDHGSS